MWPQDSRAWQPVDAPRAIGFQPVISGENDRLEAYPTFGSLPIWETNTIGAHLTVVPTGPAQRRPAKFAEALADPD